MDRGIIIGFSMEVISYRISLDIDFENKQNSGRETIEFVSGTNELKIDCVGITVSSVRENGIEVDFSMDESGTTLVVNGRAKGRRELQIEFHAEVSKTLRGFYLAKSIDGDEMLTTQFEATGARTAFPCFDRPDLKAEFLIELIIRSDLEAISNMFSEGEEQVAEGRKKVVFGKTPRMSTYLLYFAVGRFSRLEDSDGKVKYSLISQASNPPTSSYPIEIAKKCVKYYNQYFGIDYVMPKMDLIAIPQFAAGAMENWGAITFREVEILTSSSTSSRVRKRVAETVAHEITHQWFGNLVTMKWWNDLWLNESFATFMSYKAINDLYPPWKSLEYFYQLRYGPAMLGDSLHSSHPIDVEVTDPETISQIFDEISYGKGSSILRMFESYVGEDSFRDGISGYLKNHSFGNAEGRELWEELEKSSGKKVAETMKAWITKVGYPLITIRRNGDNVKLSQERFLLNGISHETWPVPVDILDADGPRTILMTERETEIKAHGYMVVNPSRKGFYRVLYDEDVESLINRMGKMSEEEQWGMMMDYFALLLSGRIELDVYLSLADSVLGSRNKMPIQAVADQISLMHSISAGESRIGDFALRFLKGAMEIAREKSEKDERFLELEGVLSSRLAIIDRNYAGKISGEFARFVELKPDLRLGVAMAFALTENRLDIMMDTMKMLKADEDRIKVISAMGWLKGEGTIEKVTGYIMEGRIKKQDMISYYLQAAMNPANREEIFGKFPGIVKMAQEIFAGGINASKLVEAVLPVIGASRRDDAVRMADVIKKPGVEKGVMKGLELLEVYSRLYSRIT